MSLSSIGTLDDSGLQASFLAYWPFFVLVYELAALWSWIEV